MSDFKSSLTGKTDERSEESYNNAYDVYTEENDDNLNKSQNEKEDKLADFMKNIAIGKLEKFKNLENLFGGVFKNIDWSAFLDKDKLKEMLLNWLKEKATEIGDKVLQALDEMKDQLIEYGKEKLENIIETAIDSIMIPDEIFLTGLSGTYYLGGADLAAENEYCRNVCLMHDYPKSLEWVNKEFGYEYNFRIDSAFCKRDLRVAVSRGCHKVAYHILKYIYDNEYVRYKSDYVRYKSSYDVDPSDENRKLVEDIESDIDQIERFIIESIRSMIVYSYQTLTPNTLSEYINYLKNTETDKPIFLPRYLGETDVKYSGRYFLRKGELDTMVTFVSTGLAKTVNDAINSQVKKVIFKKKVISKVLNAETDDSLANSLTSDISVSSISFEPHEESTHKKIRSQHLDEFKEVSYRNSLIKFIYVFLTNRDLWGDDVMVHCHFYNRLKYPPKNVISETANVMINSPLGGLLGDAFENGESSGVDYVRTLDASGVLFDPATFLAFGDVTNLVNLFYSNFPVVGGADNVTLQENNMTMNEIETSVTDTMEKHSTIDKNYYKEFMYIDVDSTSSPSRLVEQAKGVFSRIRDTILSVINDNDPSSLFYKLKIEVNKQIRYIHEKYFNKLHSGSQKGSNPDEMFDLAQFIFPNKQYETMWEEDNLYLDLRIIYGLYMFYYIPNYFHETNTRTVTYLNLIDQPLSVDMTLRRHFRIIDNIFLFTYYVGKEYAYNQDNTISVILKDFITVYKYLRTKSDVTVPLNTAEIMKDELTYLENNLYLDMDSYQAVDAQLRVVDINTKYKYLRETNRFLSEFVHNYLVSNTYTNPTHNINDRTVHSSDSSKKVLNRDGFKEIYLNGIIKIFEIIFNAFTANIYDINNVDAVNAENSDVDDPFTINSVLNSISDYVDKNGYLSHLKFVNMRFGISFSKFTK